MVQTLEERRAKRREYSRRWRETHPGYNAQKVREYYEKHPEKRKAVVAKILDRDPEYYNRRTKAWFKAHPGYASPRHRLVNEAKSQPCADCGVQYPSYVMDLDHVPERGKKKFNMSRQRGGFSVDELREELVKCDPVCANCHRERTHQRRIKRA